MSIVDDFWSWAKKFTAIYDRHIKEFLNSTSKNFNLHQAKTKFASKYQDRIALSYTLETEFKYLNPGKHSNLKNSNAEEQHSEDKFPEIDRDTSYGNGCHYYGYCFRGHNTIHYEGWGHTKDCAAYGIYFKEFSWGCNGDDPNSNGYSDDYNDGSGYGSLEAIDSSDYRSAREDKEREKAIALLAELFPEDE